MTGGAKLGVDDGWWVQIGARASSSHIYVCMPCRSEITYKEEERQGGIKNSRIIICLIEEFSECMR